MLQIVELLLQRIKILHLQDRALKILSGFNNLISDILENSDMVSQMSILMQQISVALCYDNESSENSRWYHLNSNWQIQRPLWSGVWFDFGARCYWTFSLPRTSWRTTDCIEKTNVYGCGWQVWCCWKKHPKWIKFQQRFNHTPLLKHRYRSSFFSDYVPTPDKENFVFIITQPVKMYGELWVMIVSSRYKLYFADSLGGPSFLKQQYNRWCQNHYILIPALAFSTQYTQLFIPLGSGKKKLQEFTMSKYIRLIVTTCSSLVFSM